MLTKDRIEIIRKKAYQTKEEKIILCLFDNFSGATFSDKLAEKCEMELPVLLLHIRKSKYILHDNNLVKLKRQGKEHKIESDPMENTSVGGFVQSIMYQDPDISFEDMLDKVKYFCGVKGKTTGYNKPQHAYYRKIVKKMKG